jgi:hypothetical protein
VSKELFPNTVVSGLLSKRMIVSLVAFSHSTAIADIPFGCTLNLIPVGVALGCSNFKIMGGAAGSPEPAALLLGSGFSEQPQTTNTTARRTQKRTLRILPILLPGNASEIQYGDFKLSSLRYYSECELTPIPAALPSRLSSTHMILGHLYIPPTAILFAILGFSLFIAGMDFAKRRAATRALELSTPHIPATRTNPIVDPRPVGPIAGIAGLPHTDRAVASLPVANFLPLPRPTPRMPRHLESPNQPVSWAR